MAVIQVACIQCRKADIIVKKGKGDNGNKRYLCRNFHNSLQLKYRSNGGKHGPHDCIINMMINYSGVRDISQLLKISPTTVISHVMGRGSTNTLKTLLNHL